MTIKQLIAVLKTFSQQDDQIYFSRDPEGNGFNDLGDQLMVDKSYPGILLVFPSREVPEEEIGL